jgi:hypothetical protein
MNKEEIVHHVYIDTNIYLTFYSFTNDDLNTLKKFIGLLKAKKVILYMPEQTLDEYYRNREVKITESLKNLRENKLNSIFPKISHSYKEYADMRKAIKVYEQNKSKLMEKLDHDIDNFTLQADEVLSDLFENITSIQTTEEILQLARWRRDVGNPPGKDNKLGDAINWESLLCGFKEGKNLYFVSDDKDFYSTIDISKIKSTLIAEWKAKKNSKIFAFRKLSEFLNKHYKGIELLDELDKETIISDLSEVGNFSNAKGVINKLRTYENFSIQQLNDITKAFTENSQIYWIAEDHPVLRAREDIIEKNKDKIDEEIFKQYILKYKEEEKEGSD